MKRFKVKICGMKDVALVSYAIELGADLIGIILFNRSPRFVSQKQAKEIVRSLQPVIQSVGVFVNEETETILRLRDKLRFDFAQIHGLRDNSTIRTLQRNGLKVIESFTVRTKKDFLTIAESEAEIIMLDNTSEEKHGGTGKPFDWRLRPAAPLRNLMVAGGIDADNVAKAVKAYCPMIVDVNSGVESSLGVKSQKKLKQFFTQCNAIRYGK
ncbi:MAG: phosphoribosylanthranilate isomerase [candidate division Zixibacteria bacterium]|nr:phosphoribosylanthranilate isomerase [candidate division Zixibacteria bacterium]